MHVLTLCGRICIGLSLRALLAALWNKAGHYILPCGFCLCVFLLLLLFSSPILSDRRLDVYHTSIQVHMVWP